MIGLVIVVILISIGLLLYLKLGVFREETVKEDATVQSTYVTNLMRAVFNVKICQDSDPKKVDEVLLLCFENEVFCGETRSCDYVKNQIRDIIGSVGIKDYKNYSIWVSKGGSTVNISNECKTGILAHTTIVTPDREHYTAYFRVC